MITYPLSENPKENEFGKGGIHNNFIVKNVIENKSHLIEYDLDVLRNKFPFLKDKPLGYIYDFVKKVNQSIIQFSVNTISNK